MGSRRHGQLTQKERAFLTLFLGTCAGNATEAAWRAGYGTKRSTARRLATRLLSKVHIQRALAMRNAARDAKAIATATERDAMYSRWLDDPTLGPEFKLKVAARMDRNEARGSSRAAANQGVTLAEAMALSRVDEKPAAKPVEVKKAKAS